MYPSAILKHFQLFANLLQVYLNFIDMVMATEESVGLCDYFPTIRRQENSQSGHCYGTHTLLRALWIHAQNIPAQHGGSHLPILGGLKEEYQEAQASLRCMPRLDTVWHTRTSV